MGFWGVGWVMYGIGFDYFNGFGEVLVDCVCRISSYSSDGCVFFFFRLVGIVVGGDL